MLEKERKKKEELLKWEEQFRAISMENYQARKIATEKKQAQYRPSHDIKHLGGKSGNLEKQESLEENPTEKRAFKIQEDYDMNEESNEDDEIIIGTFQKSPI